jgi:hypothetical protein
MTSKELGEGLGLFLAVPDDRRRWRYDPRTAAAAPFRSYEQHLNKITRRLLESLRFCAPRPREQRVRHAFVVLLV